MASPEKEKNLPPTDNVSIPALDVESLPGLRDLFGGQLNQVWRHELQRAAVNLLDPSTNPDAKRVIEMQISFLPESDRTSCLVSVSKIGTKLVGCTSPQPTRIIFRKSKAGLRASVRDLQREELVFPGMEFLPVISVEKLPGLHEIFGGEIENSWRRELIRVLLNVDDPRTEAARMRTVDLKIALTSDPSRSMFRFEVAKLETKIATVRHPKPCAMYVESNPADGSISLEYEPAADLPDGEGGVTKGRQSTIN